MKESMDADASNEEKAKNLDIVTANRQQTELRFQNTELFFDSTKGQHALKSLKPIPLQLLQNYAYFKNVSVLHNTMLLLLTWLQNFRGATSTLFQPQKYMNEHIYNSKAEAAE